ncbi:hypothetical protein ONE63_001670 [Megalurothrips usitatus]|uniref:DDE-1 domain-containing protein n=1 Tax=Megalurothrips usitatus TaxID=439358 RepID=A0AAV7XDN8_9NEOP|nr:hypothetical protein ONE63_001670 [Megalurothrips usitatus]
MRRSGLALRRRTSICQKLPANFEHQLREFQKYVINLRTRGNFPMGHIGNADETPIYQDMPYNYTVHEKGAKQVQLKTTGCEKLRITVMLGGLADGRMKSELVVIPAGMTSVLQPMDVCINKPFKDRLKKIYAGWLSDPARELTPSGKIKRAPPDEVARWLSRAWKAIPEEIMARAFKKCCISNNLDGTEDDVLWEGEIAYKFFWYFGLQFFGFEINKCKCFRQLCCRGGQRRQRRRRRRK